MRATTDAPRSNQQRFNGPGTGPVSDLWGSSLNNLFDLGVRVFIQYERAAVRIFGELIEVAGNSRPPQQTKYAGEGLIIFDRISVWRFTLLCSFPENARGYSHREIKRGPNVCNLVFKGAHTFSINSMIMQE